MKKTITVKNVLDLFPHQNYIKRKKRYGRLRCKCCHGLVRNKSRIYRTNFMPSIRQPNS